MSRKVTTYEEVKKYAGERFKFYHKDRKTRYIPNIITTEEDLRKLAVLLKVRPSFAYDTETTGTRVNAPGVERLVGISISWGMTHTYYIACGHTTGEDQVSVAKVVEYLKPIFEDKDKFIIGHNLKFDMHILANYGIEFSSKVSRRKLFDTMRASWLCDENSPNTLEANSLKHLGIQMLSFTEVAKLGIPIESKRELGLRANQIGSLDMVSIPIVGSYALDDAYCTWRLHKHFEALLEREGYTDYYYSVDLPYTLDILFNKERRGVRIDQKKLDYLRMRIQREADKLQYDIYSELGFEFNMNSAPQTSYVIFDHLGFEPIKVTEAGNASVAGDVIEDLANQFYSDRKMRRNVKILQKIRNFKRLDKLISFLNSIEENMYPDGKVHSNFGQVTVTGRLSCTNINLQQQPNVEKLSDDDVRKSFDLREVYVADKEDRVIITADYSNLELRILTHFSEDRNLTEAFNKGQDVHSRTAVEMFYDKEEGEKIFKKDPLLRDFRSKHADLRDAGKTINFGMIYGMQAKKLAQSLSQIWKREVAQSEAEELFETYFNKLPGVNTFISGAKDSCRRSGFVNTIIGRKRRLPDIWGSRWQRSRAERQAVNSIIQGSAADIVVASQLRINTDKVLDKLDVKMLIQVHDEIVFECPKKNAVFAVRRIKKLMSNPFSEPLLVDLTVDAGVGKSWGSAK